MKFPVTKMPGTLCGFYICFVFCFVFFKKKNTHTIKLTLRRIIFSDETLCQESHCDCYKNKTNQKKCFSSSRSLRKQPCLFAPGPSGVSRNATRPVAKQGRLFSQATLVVIPYF